MSQEKGIIQDGLTNKSQSGTYNRWSTPNTRWSNSKLTNVWCPSYSYGQVIISTKSHLAKRLLKRNTYRYPILVKAKKGKAYPAWVCSLGYMYRRTPRMKISVRYLESLKYCEHLEKVREEGYIKKCEQLAVVMGESLVKNKAT